MSISSLSRVSNLLRTSVANQNITKSQQLLIDVQNQLATGQRVNNPSDDPGAAATLQQLNKMMERRKSYSANLKNASTQLNEVDTQMDSMTTLLQQAKTIASKDVGSDVSADARAADADVISSLYSQMLSIANTQFGGVYLFGGDAASSSPFVETAAGVQFTGSNRMLANVFDDNVVLPFMANGADVFGATSSPVTSADLTPAVDANTRIADLRGKNLNGVALSSIQISDGTTTAKVDLSKADTLGDVKTAIENAIPGLTVGFSGGGLTITGGATANITVQEVGSGTCADDLGILNTSGAGTTLTGAGMNPKITPLTPMTQLGNAMGLDLSGLQISNGGKTQTITLAATDTVETFLNKINSAGLGVQASISDDGTHLQIVNATQGATMSIGENGGTTATQLGLRTMTGQTKLSDLNGGKGVQTSSNPLGDLRITDSNGVIHLVTLNGLTTVQDVLNKIAADTGNQVTATLATSGNGIVLTDAAGGSGTMKVEAANYSTAMADLGLGGTVSGNVLTGTDVSGVKADGIFAHLQALRSAMLKGDQGAMTTAADALDKDWGNVAKIRGQIGARVQEIESRQTRMDDENVSTKSLVSTLQDLDFTDAITKFQNLQTSLQATLQASGKTLGMSLLDFLS